MIAPYLFGWKIPEEQIFPFDVLVQIGTLLAVIVYFRRDLWNIIVAVLAGIKNRSPFENQQSRLGWYIVLGTIPAGIFGLLVKDLVEQAFNSPRATAFFLLGTAIILVIAEKIGRRSRGLDSLTWKDELWIGAAQALAVFPGISRSGSTIAGGMLRNLERKPAGRFSFLLMIPVMLAAGLLSLLDLFKVPDLANFMPSMLTGFLAAAVVGYLAIHWLLAFLGRRPLYVFSAYCVLLAGLTLFISYV